MTTTLPASFQHLIPPKMPSTPKAGSSRLSMPSTPELKARALAAFKNMKRPSSFWPTDRELLRRRPSLELLVPAHDCESRRSSPAIAIFNLMATVCGGGVLTLPIAFSRAGLLPSFLMMVFAAGITHFAMYILCSCARRTGGRSYGDVMRNAFGPLAEIGATVLLFFLLFMVLVAYMVLLKDIWTPVILKLVPALANFLYSKSDNDDESNAMMDEASNSMLVLLLVLILPLLLQTDLHALRHTCYVGFASAVILMLGVIYQAVDRNWVEEPGLFQAKVLWVGDYDGILYAYPIIVLSFFSIYNVLTVHSALYNPTRERVKVVLDGTIALCFLLFFTVGIFGYLYAYNETRDNILLNFPLSAKSIMIGRIGYGFTIMFGMPLVFLPCRAAILSLPTQIQEWREAVEHVEEGGVQAMMKGTKNHIPNGVTFDEECPLLLETQKKPSTENVSVSTDTSTERDEQSSYETFVVTTTPLPPVDPSLEAPAALNKRVHLLSTLAILATTYVMAVGVPGVGIVWRIAGSSVTLVIGFIIPCSCYLKIRSKKSVNPRSVGASLLLMFSIVSSVVCTVRTLGDLSAE